MIYSVNKLYPQGTNSTMFTECCSVAITRSEKKCPYCNSLIIGYDAQTDHERDIIRWRSATSNWKRNK
jgi:hypothetical protein